jgi:hypothetical protein
MVGLVVHWGTLVSCLGTLSSIRIPGIVHKTGSRLFRLYRQFSVFAGLDSLRGLTFEEGTVRIGVATFFSCSNLENPTFPSLIIIEAGAFLGYDHLWQVTFAVDSQLQYICSSVFADWSQNGVVVPSSIREINDYAFSGDAGRRSVKSEGALSDRLRLHSFGRFECALSVSFVGRPFVESPLSFLHCILASLRCE